MHTKRNSSAANRPLFLFLIARVLIALATQMLTIAVGWQMYALTGSPFYLGLIGLAQFFPMFLLTLVVGYAADRYDRRIIICICQMVECAAVLVLALGSFRGWLTKEGILAIVFLIGSANAFLNPSLQAMLPNIVPKELFPNAAASSTSVFHSAVIVGPALGGMLYSLGPEVVYIIIAALAFSGAMLVLFISFIKGYAKAEPATIQTIFKGISFIKSRPEILGAISLDLFAVLFGGATALLPVFADTVLHIGSFGLGLLRSAPAAGAMIVSAYLARRPLQTKVGHKMFVAVAVFGISTVLFALSTSLFLSLAILVVMGAANVVSVVIRSTLIQLMTPDNMRGRVSSVNSLFTGTSNQLGEFESGLTSAWFGVVPAVVIGGIGTLVVALWWIKLFPGLYRVDRLKAGEN